MGRGHGSGSVLPLWRLFGRLLLFLAHRRCSGFGMSHSFPMPGRRGVFPPTALIAVIHRIWRLAASTPYPLGCRRWMLGGGMLLIPEDSVVRSGAGDIDTGQVPDWQWGWW